jgi:electron transport complex protein RnfG
MTQGVATPSYRKRLGYQSGLLGGMGLLASVVLVISDIETRDAIATAKAADKKASLEQVIPKELYDNNLLQDTLVIPATFDETTQEQKSADTTIYLARDKQAQITAVAFEQAGYGYSGLIDIIMGIDRTGKILGVRVLSHSETPGLGDRIETEKGDWIFGFNGLSLEKPLPELWKVKKDGGYFDQFTGATITPRSVVKIVHQGLVFYAQHKTDILQQEDPAMNTFPEMSMESMMNEYGTPNTMPGGVVNEQTE